MNKKLIFVMVLLVFVLASCAPGANTAVDVMEDKMPGAGAEVMEKTTTPEAKKDMAGEKEAMMDATATPEMMEKTIDPMLATATLDSGSVEQKDRMSPAWFAAELTDAGTGETFRIEDLKGKVVLVQNFAQWCSTCLRQQKEFTMLNEMLGMPDDLVMVSLDVDLNEDEAMLKAYLDKHGFDWRFAIAPADTVREIGSLYGPQFLNPPSAPVLVIDRQGNVYPLSFGVKSAEDLQETLKPYLDGGM